MLVLDCRTPGGEKGSKKASEIKQKTRSAKARE